MDASRTQLNAGVPSYGAASLESGGGGRGIDLQDPFASPPQVITAQPSTSNGIAGNGSNAPKKLDKAPLILDDELNSTMQSPLPPAPTSPTMELASARPNGLSTISGVYAPVALSMFSVLLFLRMGFVVGQLGFLMTVVELLMSYAIVLLTVLSLCAISSNGAIEGGGVYYMISRSLGPEFGGAIGVLFFTANVFSCALYVSGFTEALLNNLLNGQMPDSPFWKFFYCVLVSLVLLVLCLLGAGIFAKTALLTFVVITVCYSTYIITAIFRGPFEVPIPKVNTAKYTFCEMVNGTEQCETLLNETVYSNYTAFRFSTLGENMLSNYTKDYTTDRQTDFALMFAIIFSGVTGLMAGANMSGELARPSVSIPRGTVQAVFTTFLVYVLTAFLMASTCSRDLLQNDYTVMMDVNFSKWFILIGIFSTTLFSSMSNLIGSSRVLNRLSHDKLFGFILRPARIEFGTNNNPIVSVIITWFCVVLVLMIGAMNKIAKLTSIFFLLSYMGVNIATLALELTSAPNFRPTFKYFSWQTCAAGVLCTTVMMLVIDAAMSAIAVVVLLLLIMLLHYQAPAGSWGSISQALIYHQVRKYLLLLDVRKEHVKYWRPQVLLLVSRPASAWPLMDFVNDLKKSGLYVVGHVKKGDLDDNQSGADPLQRVFPYWLSLVDYLKLKAFVELTLSNSVRHGIQQLMRLSGLGAMKPNTVVLGFHEERATDSTLEESRLLKDLRYSRIDRSEVVEYFTAGDYMPRELNGNRERLSGEEYVRVLNDVLHLNKNLCLARHFHKMDKDAMVRNWNGQKRFIDVWPVDLQKPQETGLGWDNSSLFLLQLSCILSMSSRWKSYTQLRVFICVNSLQDMHRRERQLKAMLDQLRIKGKNIVVPWDHVVCHFAPGAPPNTQRASTDLPTPYVKAMNEMIRRYSSDAVICMLNLPLPPDDADALSARYLEKLRDLTADLPPTLLVHGVSSVISTSL